MRGGSTQFKQHDTDGLRVLLADAPSRWSDAWVQSLKSLEPTWQFSTTATPAATLATILENRHDVVLLEWDFSEAMTGLDICLEARSAGSAVPIVIVTATVEDLPHRIAALDAGADAFLVKSCVAPAEVRRHVQVAFLKAPERRTPVPPGSDIEVVVGPITVYTRAMVVFVSGRRLQLTVQESQIMVSLARTPHQPVPHAELCQAGRIEPSQKFKNLHNEISRIRQKLGPVAAKYLQSVRSIGYRLGEPEEG